MAVQKSIPDCSEHQPHRNLTNGKTMRKCAETAKCHAHFTWTSDGLRCFRILLWIHFPYPPRRGSDFECTVFFTIARDLSAFALTAITGEPYFTALPECLLRIRRAESSFKGFRRGVKIILLRLRIGASKSEKIPCTRHLHGDGIRRKTISCFHSIVIELLYVPRLI